MLSGVIALRGLVLALKGLVVLILVNAGLHMLGLLVLFIWGLILVVTAHAVHPVPITGIVSDAVERYQGSSYVRTDFSLENDQRVFATNGPALQPPLTRSHPAAGDLVTVWINPGIDWFDISRTDILAISIAPESPARPAHVEWGYAHPNDQAVRERLIGFGILATVGLILGLGILWDWLSGRRSGKRRPPPLGGQDWHRYPRRPIGRLPKLKAMVGELGFELPRGQRGIPHAPTDLGWALGVGSPGYAAGFKGRRAAGA